MLRLNEYVFSANWETVVNVESLLTLEVYEKETEANSISPSMA